MSKIMSEEELVQAFEAAQQKADEAEDWLQKVPEGTTPEEKADREAEFQAATAELERLSGALRRKEERKQAIKEIPLPPPEGAPAGSLARVNEQVTYRRRGPYSFFHDILYSKQGDPAAEGRLQRHAKEMADAQRKADAYAEYAMTTASGSGLGFVAPQYLQDEWAAFARAARPLADAIGSRPLPDAGVSFNLPRITTGATAAVQSSEGAAVADNSQVTDTITLPLSTISAKTDMSRQAFDRSEPGLDDIIGQDLAAAYALQVDSEIINGSGSAGRVKGILSAAAANTIAATATAVGVYPKVADAIQRVDTNRYLPASLIVMHPRRWAQFLATLDTQSRPLVVPSSVAFNPMGVGGTGPNVAQGFVGYDLQGLPVLKDANIPTNLGTSTNEDRIIVTRREDLYLFEGPSPTVRVYEEVLSGTLQVRIQCFGYIAFTAERYVNATYLITGLTTPSF